MAWNLLLFPQDKLPAVHQFHSCSDILPTLFLQLFAEHASLCALTEEDSRAVLSDIL